MRVYLLQLLLVFGLTSGSSHAAQKFHRFYQPQLNSEGRVTIAGKWHEIPAAQVANPKTWVAPFLESGSQLMPKCSLTSQAGVEVTSVMGIQNPLITIRVSEEHSLAAGVQRSDVLQRMIECIQLNMREGAFINVKVSVGQGVSAEKFVQFDGSYTTLKESRKLG